MSPAPTIYEADEDLKSHYGVIIAGAGLSGIAMNVQLKRLHKFTDVMCYEREADFGGTWMSNTYPGASCDIPVGLYSYSFAQKVFSCHWPGQKEILDYMHEVVAQFKLRNITLKTSIEEASYADGIWTLRIKNLETGVESVKTCNVFVSAVGGLREPSIPAFAAGNKDFEGEVWHTARWNHDVDITGKHVVLVGNGCTAAQVVPNVINKVASLTQVARSRQSYLPLPKLLANHWFYFWMLRHVPGFLALQRFAIYCVAESAFKISDIVRGAGLREYTRNLLARYIRRKAPAKYTEALTPDFDLGAKRRIFDSGYLGAMHNPKFTLVQGDAVVSMKGRSVRTANGLDIPADIVVLSTGFRVQDYFFPLRVSARGEELVTRLQEENGKMYRGTVASGYPNFFVLQGPNTVTGHSSVIFTSEAQITMTLKLITPILKKLKSGKALSSPAPSVEVTPEAETEYYSLLRTEMKRKVWEKDGGVSWYVNDKGLCIALYPWSQTNFWYHATYPNKAHFRWSGC
ncbi:hypothetical protein RQP46_003530 [Phenoliferia psychrophenolica]